ncbi:MULTISPECIES: hypothetical protein [unclassified Coleofasciculus]|uniref:hypothetical protein n=1 Tax=unclassified Coleofasciculus TaxID=2692782 RepID=UPI00187EB3E2|nr:MULTISPECIES: hypothetical protein [unclassified Coleofasciculus]MBE9126059.1 hypothetical protein [Coleofasciculus sp. LEGE 07081]MBE9149472.1 hypothetical protein [Coleofasciculus sp. LEGE 07092]
MKADTTPSNMISEPQIQKLMECGWFGLPLETAALVSGISLQELLSNRHLLSIYKVHT